MFVARPSKRDRPQSPEVLRPDFAKMRETDIRVFVATNKDFEQAVKVETYPRGLHRCRITRGT